MLEQAKDAIMAFERALHHFRELTKMIIFVRESGTIYIIYEEVITFRDGGGDGDDGGVRAK